MLDFRRIEGTVQKVHFRISTDHENNMLSVRLPGEIDLVSLSISFEFAVPYYQLQLIFFLLNLFIKMSLNFHNSGRCIALVVVYWGLSYFLFVYCFVHMSVRLFSSSMYIIAGPLYLVGWYGFTHCWRLYDDYDYYFLRHLVYVENLFPHLFYSKIFSEEVLSI